MKRSLIEIYALAVCFVTMLAATIAVGIAMWDAVQIAAPEFAISEFAYERHIDNQSFDGQACAEYATDREAAAAAVAEVAGDTSPRRCLQRLTDAEVTARREASWAKELRNEQRNGFQSLVRCLIFVLVVLAVFAVHWRMARRERTAASAT